MSGLAFDIAFVSIMRYLVTLSSQLTIANITPMEMRQTLKNTVQATQIGHAL